MTGDASQTEVEEGDVRLLVHGANKDRGPGTRDAAVFYNPAMGLNRDLSVLLLDVLCDRDGFTVLDGLTASGARAVRMAKAVPRAVVQANDWNPVAAALAEENARRNDVKVAVTRANLGALLWTGAWDWVDVDPFGSPAPFVDAATRALRGDAMLAITATDTTALAGVYPDVCRRRYLASPLRGEVVHEVALRILAGFAARMAAKHDVALEPALAHATDHYYRLYLRARRGANRANDALARIGHAWLCRACGARGTAADAPRACPACADAGVRAGGPLWTGALQDGALLAAARARIGAHVLARPEEADRALALLEDEARGPPLFFDLHRAASRAGVDAAPRDAAMQALRDAGFVAARTHVSRLGVKTDASAEELSRVLRSIGNQSDKPGAGV